MAASHFETKLVEVAAPWRVKRASPVLRLNGQYAILQSMTCALRHGEPSTATSRC